MSHIDQFVVVFKNTIDQTVYIWYHKWTGGDENEN